MAAVVELPKEVLDFFLLRYVLTQNISSAMRATYAEFDSEEKGEGLPVGLTRQKFYNYVRSTSGKEGMAEVQVRLQDEVKKRPLAQDFGRIEVLCQTLGRLLMEFERKEITIRERVQLAGEIRQFVNSLRAETEPFDFEAIRDFIYEHIRRVIERYGQHVQTWDAISGVHAHNAFNLNFEQLMELTRLASESCS